MTFKKRILSSNLAHIILSYIVYIYIKFVYFTSKIEISVDKEFEKLDNQPVIFASWHGRLLMIAMLVRIFSLHRHINILISSHNDGRIIAKTIKHFGCRTINGSTNREAVKSAKEIISSLKKGENIGITPDGPRGPIYKAALGSTRIANKLGVAIIPLSFSSSKHKILGSWDRFMLPLPFSKITYVVGKPLFKAKNIELEQGLNDVLRISDELVNEN